MENNTFQVKVRICRLIIKNAVIFHLSSRTETIINSRVVIVITFHLRHILVGGFIPNDRVLTKNDALISEQQQVMVTGLSRVQFGL